MSRSDVFGGDDFEDIIAAVNSLETRHEDDVNSNLPCAATNGSIAVQPYMADISFESPDQPVPLFASVRTESVPVDREFAPESAARDSTSLLEPDALYAEPVETFDGVAAANEIASLFYEAQSTQPHKVTEPYVDETLAAREISDDTDLKPPATNVPETPAVSMPDKPARKPTSRIISLYSFSQHFPRLYLGVAAAMALFGFAYIMTFPALFAVATLNGFEMLNNPFAQHSPILLVSLFSISLFLFLISYKLFDLKFMVPEGITLDDTNASGLMEKLRSLNKEQRVLKIHQVILTRRHELNVIKVPRFGLPIWSRNILAVGYPLLQTLPPEHFDCAVARRLAQYSKRRGLLSNWLSFMRQVWTLYATSMKARNEVIDLIHYCFFAPYASLYRRFAVYITQKDELRADDLALAVVNGRDLLKSAQTLRITQAMLFQYYWPKLNDAIQNNLTAPANIRPYRNLPGTLAELLNSENVDAWFTRLSQEVTNERSAEAPFAKRMEQMGHRKVCVPKAFDISAAHHYFGGQYETMTNLMDELWADEVQKTLFIENLERERHQAVLPFRLSIQTA